MMMMNGGGTDLRRREESSIDDPGIPQRIDGRVMRGLRNRQALIDAYYELAGEQLDLPRAADVAQRAGVSVRSLFQHFRDLDELRAAVVEEMCHRTLELLLSEHGSMDPSHPLHARIDGLLRARSIVWEMLSPLRQVNLLNDGSGRDERTNELISQVRTSVRDHLRLAFEVELRDMPMDFELALSAFQATLSSATWDHLRLVHGYDVETTVGVMKQMSLAILLHRPTD